jgi:coenzyme F420-0:L-glutamate ligase / coenzyme F420-1:gamma-L-glutamate ligase
VSGGLEVTPVSGLPEVGEGDSVGGLLAEAIGSAGIELDGREVVVVSQKIVSKAEGRVRDLAAVTPTPRARALAAELGKEPRLVQAILDETRAVIRAEAGVLIVETTSGWICANAGIDSSNVPGGERVTLLPLDADASARAIRDQILEATGVAPAVVVADSFGRPWRLGQVEVAIGCAGLAPLDDWRGRADREGRELAATAPAIADQAAAAADLVRDKASGTAVVLIRGLDRHVIAGDGAGAVALRRAEGDDLFR